MGLIISERELPFIRKRFLDPLYKSEVERIRSSAEELTRNPLSTLYKGPLPLDSVVQKWSTPESGNLGMSALNAAFLHLVTGEDKYYQSVVKALNAQSREKNMDFRSLRWQKSSLQDINPGFQISEWLARWIVAYDLIPYLDSVFNEWALSGALLFQKNLEDSLNSKYENRAAGKLKAGWTFSDKTDIGGGKVERIDEVYNNRNGALAKLCATAGLKFKNQSLQNSAKNFFKEWVRYQLNDFIIDESYRRSKDNPVGYMCSMAHIMVQIADMFARVNQDVSLYEYKVNGIGLQEGIEGIFRVFDRSLKIDPEYQEGINRSNFDYWFAQSNLYYKSHNIRRVYTERKRVSNPLSAGPHPWQSGSGGLCPSTPLLYSNMEGVVNPYFVELPIVLQIIPGVKEFDVDGKRVKIEIVVK